MQIGHSDAELLSATLRELYAHTDAATLPSCIVRLLRRVIPCTSAAYNFFDFRTRDMQIIHDHGPEADRMMPALKEHMHLHPLVAHLQEHWRDGAVRLSDVVSAPKLRDNPVYCEFLRPLGLNRQMSMLMEDREYAIVGMSMQRQGSDFTKRDREMMSFLQPHLIQAYRNAADISRTNSRAVDLEAALGGNGLEVVRLTRGLQIDWMSRRAQEWLEGYFPIQGPKLPGALAEWIVSQGSARDASIGEGWDSRRLFSGERGCLEVRWICQPGGHGLLVLKEERTATRIEALKQLGLSCREAEVLHWIAEGKPNRDIAMILSLSVRTIEKHVENIFAKLGVETRIEAALRALHARQH